MAAEPTVRPADAYAPSDVGRDPKSGKEYIVTKYHRPSIGVIIPHYNYSDHICEALISVQQQTHANFTCVIVDDSSDQAHFDAAREEISRLADNRFRLVRNNENQGQIHSVFRGIDELNDDFIAILDPDDRYTPQFLERMLALHLNGLVFCPLASCDQYLLKTGNGITNATYRMDGFKRIRDSKRAGEEKLTFLEHGFHRFVPPDTPGWHWTSTSAMMFRTAALKMIRPHKKLKYKRSVDAYCAYAVHFMGGSIVLNEPLVYRGMHGSNSYLSDSLFSMYKKKQNHSFIEVSQTARIDAVEAFIANGGLDWFDHGDVRNLIQAQFQGQMFGDLLAAVPQVREILAEKK